MAKRHGVVAIDYPEPEATHEQVVADAEIFQHTLDNLLTHLGIKLRVPKVGGIEVNLHLLYKQVTSLHGLSAVISRKQWVIVCEPFNFPPSFTNKSFVIRKLYCNALHHYEQLYFFRRQGPLVPAPTCNAPGELQQPSPNMGQKRKLEPVRSEPGSLVMQQPLAVVAAGGSNSSGSPPRNLPDGTRFTGVIDCSVDCGYQITINLPGRSLHGMLFKQAPHDLPPPPMGHLQPGGPGLPTAKPRSADESSAISRENPRLPRPAKTPFQFFQMGVSKQQLLQLHKVPFHAQYPPTDELLASLTADLWRQMTPEQLKPFLDMAERDRDRFEREWNEYRRRLCDGVTTPPPSPLQGPVAAPQRPAPSSHQPARPQQPSRHQRHHSSSDALLSFNPDLHPIHPIRRLEMQLEQEQREREQQQQQLHPRSMPRQAGVLPARAMSLPPGVHALSSAPGFQLLPRDMEPEELDNLCHYNEGMQGFTQNPFDQHHMHNGPDAHAALHGDMDLHGGMEPHRMAAGNVLQDPVADEWNALAMHGMLHGHAAGAGQLHSSMDAIIDCSVQVNSSAPGLKAECKAQMTNGTEHAKDPMQQLAFPGVPANGSPSDVHVTDVHAFQKRHDFEVGGTEPLYHNHPSPFEGELLDGAHLIGAQHTAMEQL